MTLTAGDRRCAKPLLYWMDHRAWIPKPDGIAVCRDLFLYGCWGIVRLKEDEKRRETGHVDTCTAWVFSNMMAKE